MKTVNVDLGERSYPIVIGRSLLDGDFDLAEYVRGGDCLVVSNETVAPLYLDKLMPNLRGRNVDSISIPDGESFTQCLGGALVGKEVFTTATVQRNGKTIGQGPCALIVPADVQVHHRRWWGTWRAAGCLELEHAGSETHL